MKRFDLTIGLILILSAIVFNLWLYRSESTVHIDPNDNAFQYALVDRTNEIWDYANKNCTNSFQISNFKFRIFCQIGYLTDHWVPNWAEGYNLPTYYSHIPQIFIVGSYRMITSVAQITNHKSQFSNNSPNLKSQNLNLISNIENLNLFKRFFENCKLKIENYTLFTHYHLIIYLLLCFFPLSIFLALRIMRQSWLTAGIGALFAALISTDGLYGLDPSSYLWRGWGLSSQLFGAIFLPLAIAFAIRACDASAKNIHFILAVLFLTLTTAGHLGIGLMAFLALPVIAWTPTLLSLLHAEHYKTIWVNLLSGLTNLLKIAVPPLVILSYWIIPIVLGSAFHNISFWDPIWKFDSYGIREVLVNLFNGNLFDFERIPVMTGLVCTGLFACLLASTATRGEPNIHNPSFQKLSFQTSPLPFLFLFFLLLYFGKTTWGGFIKMIPSMNEFHQHRFIVGVHLIGLLLAPIGLTWVTSSISSWIDSKKLLNHTSYLSLLLTVSFLCIIIPVLLPRTLSYGTYNEKLIQKSNISFSSTRDDAVFLIKTLKSLPRGRVFAGRGGSWGKEFKIGGVAAYMYLSTYGIPTILWMPETWSPNADTEQSFIEHDPTHYDLYDVRYVVTPAEMPEGSTVQSFWKLTKETATWKLYTVDISGSVVTGTAPSVVYSDKYSYKNLVRLWIQTPLEKRYIYPELRTRNYELRTSQHDTLPWFSMINPYTYQTPNGKTHALFTEPPKYMTPWEWPSAFPQYQTLITNNKQQIANSTLPITILSQSSDTDMVFRATIKIDNQITENREQITGTTTQDPASTAKPASLGERGEPRTKNQELITCPTCIVLLKHTYSPNWNVTINGEPAEPIIVFPFYTAVRLEEPGTYDIVFTYTPSRLKMILLFFPIIILGIWLLIRKIVQSKKR